MDQALPEEGDRIARLLEEVRGMAGPTTWQRVEELVRRLIGLHGAGLARVLELVSEAGRMDEVLRDRLCEDELVSSLLLLHGLHPAPTAERVARTVAQLAERLGPEVTLELLGLEPDGVVRLRLSTPGGACPSSGAALARAVEQHVIEAAPELARVEIEGVGATSPPGPERLVRLGRPRPAGEAAPP